MMLLWHAPIEKDRILCVLSLDIWSVYIELCANDFRLPDMFSHVFQHFVWRLWLIFLNVAKSHELIVIRAAEHVLHRVAGNWLNDKRRT